MVAVAIILVTVTTRVMPWQKKATTTKQKPPHPTDLKKHGKKGKSPDPKN
jgi:hypothetical protein